MKGLLLILAFFTLAAHGQTTLRFNKRFVESEDKWVAFQKDKDGTYVYGFIYIDAQAGLTLNYEGRFTIAENGTFMPAKLDSTNLKVRLEPNQVRVAFIPEEKFAELQITATPDWLKYYKTDTGSVKRLYRWGYMYNAWNECTKALTYLERAQKIDPAYDGLAVELAFSYNCLSQYDKAIAVLQEVLKTNYTDAYLHKELVYAETKSGQLEKAAESCRKAMTVCTDKTYHGEMCYNLLYNYYKLKDKKNFTLWLPDAKKWNAKNKQMMESITAMEGEMGK